jgi:hypothetical protein
LLAPEQVEERVNPLNACAGCGERPRTQRGPGNYIGVRCGRPGDGCVMSFGIRDLPGCQIHRISARPQQVVRTRTRRSPQVVHSLCNTETKRVAVYPQKGGEVTAG